MSANLFVSAHWLAERLEEADLQIVDARLAQPGTQRDVSAEYRRGHVPGAVLFDIDQLSDHSSPLPHMLLRPEAFAVAMNELAINSHNPIIIYDEGDLFAAPRAWWMLRTFGAQQLSILQGGLAGWRAAGFAEQTGDIATQRTANSAPGNSINNEFISQFDSTRVKRLTDVLLASHEHSAQIVDARAPERFSGNSPEPRPGMRSGHIPGALNVYWQDLVVNGGLKPEAELREIFHRQGVDLTRPVITSCGSGITAAVVLLALTQLGVQQVSLYDGSWSEWGARDDLPVEGANLR